MRDTMERLARSVAMLVGVGRQTANTDESKSTQQIQVAMAGDVIRERVPLLQQYGFFSRPVPGSDAVILFMGGDGGKPIAIASGDQRDRPTDIDPGEVCIYHPRTGARIWLRKDGGISIRPANAKLTIDGDTEISGSVRVSGQLEAQEVRAGGIKLSEHRHGGVQKGNNDTDKPK